MTGNALRGEITVRLDGEDYVMRPSHEAITLVEDQTGRSVLQLAQAADDGSLPLKHAAVIVTEFIKAWGRENAQPHFEKFSARRISELLFDEGLLKVNPRVALVLWHALTGGHKPGEPEAAGTTTESTMTEGTPAAA
jgi:hypothetical protein